MYTIPSKSPPAAIHTLNYDVLLRIFELNGDMFTETNHCTLDTTRMTSQVCQQWRHLMLETPSLWAKLIDVGHITRRRTGEWRTELMERSGDAPLWIRAWKSDNSEPEPSQADGKQFLYGVLTISWHRVQILVIGNGYEFIFSPFVLWKPAPQLEQFEAAHKWDVKGSGNNALIMPLFANHAPVLRNVYVGQAFLDPRAPWLSQLHCMKLDYTYSVSDALDVLSAAHNIQDVKIADLDPGDEDNSRPIIPLLRLCNLHLACLTLNSGITLLDHIEIPIHCSLDIRIDHFGDDSKLESKNPFILSAINKFFQHAKRSLESHPVNVIHLYYGRKDYIVWGCESDLPVARSLDISVPLGEFKIGEAAASKPLLHF